MSGPRLWVLNLDAEVEVEGRRPYPGPFAALAARPELEASLGGLVPAGDVVLRRPVRGTLPSGMPGRSWSPTRAARSALVAAGARVSDLPTADVLRRVMSRRFHAEVGVLLDGARFFDGEDRLAEIAELAPREGPWLARRAYGFAGRGRRVLRRASLQEADQGFLRRALVEGGLLLEPYVRRTGDFSLHGFVTEPSTTLGEPTVASVGEGGVWRGTRRADDTDLRGAEREALVMEARRAARALAEAGYEGPFGIDAFRYEDTSGERFCARCEINPRYSMGWATGMGDRRPDLD